jgi:hypothetical protein
MRHNFNPNTIPKPLIYGIEFQILSSSENLNPIINGIGIGMRIGILILTDGIEWD